jgi:transposase-like protein
LIRKLREAERMLAEGQAVPGVAKALEVSEPTFHRWRAQYGRHENRGRQGLRMVRTRF